MRLGVLKAITQNHPHISDKPGWDPRALGFQFSALSPFFIVGHIHKVSPQVARLSEAREPFCKRSI